MSNNNLNCSTPVCPGPNLPCLPQPPSCPVPTQTCTLPQSTCPPPPCQPTCRPPPCRSVMRIETKEERPKRTPWYEWVVIVILVLVVAALILIWLFYPQPTPTPSPSPPPPTPPGPSTALAGVNVLTTLGSPTIQVNIDGSSSVMNSLPSTTASISAIVSPTMGLSSSDVLSQVSTSGVNKQVTNVTGTQTLTLKASANNATNYVYVLALDSSNNVLAQYFQPVWISTLTSLVGTTFRTATISGTPRFLVTNRYNS